MNTSSYVKDIEHRNNGPEVSNNVDASLVMKETTNNVKESDDSDTNSKDFEEDNDKSLSWK